jgi:hypothetical protein
MRHTVHRPDQRGPEGRATLTGVPVDQDAGTETENSGTASRFFSSLLATTSGFKTPSAALRVLSASSPTRPRPDKHPNGGRACAAGGAPRSPPPACGF